jgi:O-antigen ligase
VARKNKTQPPSVAEANRTRIVILAVAFGLMEIAVLPGAASPFRTPKSVIAVIAIIAVVGLSTAGALRRGRLSFRWSPLVATLLALPLLQAVSVAWSGSSHLAWTSAAHSAVWIAAAVWIAGATDGERRLLIDGAAIGAALSGLVLIAQAAGFSVLTVGPAGPTGRKVLTGLTGNPADLALASVLLLPLVLGAPGGSKRPRLRWTLAALLTVAAVVSQTLTAIIALGLVWLIWLLRNGSRRAWAGAAVLAIVLLSAGLATGLGDRFRQQLVRLERGDFYFLLSARADGWTAAGEMVRTHPVTGVGAGNFTHAYYPSRVAWIERSGSVGQRAELATHFNFAHCDPLQLIAELGVPGALWLAAFIVVAFLHRPRGDPLPWLFAAAFLPFAMLHFPTHLAVGLLPIILALAHIISRGREVVFEPGAIGKRLAPALVLVLVLGGCSWQLHRLMLNLLRGGLSHALATAHTLDDAGRTHQAAAVEAQILPRIPALSGARPWLWRMVGQARFAREDYVGAETAFRNAMLLWPHEEAEFGLGLTLAAQDRQLKSQGSTLDSRNRRGEALVHLGRVCRTNPALVELIDDEDLQDAVTEIVRAFQAGG